MSYKFPKSLVLLDCYLKQKGFDTAKLRSDRHALDLLIQHTKIRVPFPRKPKPCYRSLRRMHELLFRSVPLPKAPAKALRLKGVGNSGPASDSRTVSQKTWNEIARRTQAENARAFGGNKSARR